MRLIIAAVLLLAPVVALADSLSSGEIDKLGDLKSNTIIPDSQGVLTSTLPTASSFVSASCPTGYTILIEPSNDLVCAPTDKIIPVQWK